METFNQTSLRLASEIDLKITPGHTVRIQDNFDKEYRTAVINKLVNHFGYKEEIKNAYYRKPEFLN